MMNKTDQLISFDLRTLERAEKKNALQDYENKRYGGGSEISKRFLKGTVRRLTTLQSYFELMKIL